MADTAFWIKKTLQEMTQKEWESLCDGCGKCCLHKLEDEETGDVFYTKVACEYLDIQSCRCKDYDNRKTNIPECMVLSQDMLETEGSNNKTIGNLYWLPMTCAYRLLSEGHPLPEWHPLITGTSNSVNKAGASVSQFAIPEDSVNEEDMEDQIINWVL